MLISPAFRLYERGRLFEAADFSRVLAETSLADLLESGQPLLGATGSSAASLVAATALAHRYRASILVAHDEAVLRSYGFRSLELDTGLLWHRQDAVDAFAAIGAAPEILLLTSGTTGPPKLVRRGLVGTMDLLRARAQRSTLAPPDACWLLRYNVAAFAGFQTLMQTAVAGGALAVPESSSLEAVIATIRKAAVTHVAGTPTFFRHFLAALPDGLHLPIRGIALGGEIVDQTLLDRVQRRFPAALVHHVYGSTECGVIFAVKDGRAGFPASWLATPSPHGVELDVVDGELWVRSPHGMLGYLGQHRRGPGDWIPTGDLVHVDGTRVLFLGRRDSTLKVGGATVNPEVAERLLLEIDNVVDAHVYGRASPLVGAILVAELVIDTAWAEPLIRDRVRAKLAGLRAVDVPKLLYITTTRELPAGTKKKRFDGARRLLA